MFKPKYKIGDIVCIEVLKGVYEQHVITGAIAKGKDNWVYNINPKVGFTADKIVMKLN